MVNITVIVRLPQQTIYIYIYRNFISNITKGKLCLENLYMKQLSNVKISRDLRGMLGDDDWMMVSVFDYFWTSFMKRNSVRKALPFKLTIAL